MKAALRKSVQSRIKTLSAADIQQRSALIQGRLLALPQYQNASRIAVYLSMPEGEVSTQGIVEHALESGKQVFVPYLYRNPGLARSENGDKYVPKRVMNMVALQSIEDYHELSRDKWGIPTPSEGSIPERRQVLGQAIGDPPRRQGLEQALDLIVVPGVAFDRSGKRLGHGRGFYDFFLEEYRTAPRGIAEAADTSDLPTLIALALSEQLLSPTEDIPVEAHDRKINMIVTDEGTIVR